MCYDFYLSGQITGVLNGNKELFAKYAKILRQEGWTVFNPSEQNDSDLSYEQCMKIDINMVVNMCAAIVVLPGWRKSRGANVEVLSGQICGKKIFEICDISSKKIIMNELDLKEFTLPYAQIQNI